MKSHPKAAGNEASRLISERIAWLNDWRGKTLARMRALIKEADPDVVEEVKWMGTPVWSHDGGICTGESYKSVVKLTFFKGAALKDPARLFIPTVRPAIAVGSVIAVGAVVPAVAVGAGLTLEGIRSPLQEGLGLVFEPAGLDRAVNTTLLGCVFLHHQRPARWS